MECDERLVRSPLGVGGVVGVVSNSNGRRLFSWALHSESKGFVWEFIVPRGLRRKELRESMHYTEIMGADLLAGRLGIIHRPTPSPPIEGNQGDIKTRQAKY